MKYFNLSKTHLDYFPTDLTHLRTAPTNCPTSFAVLFALHGIVLKSVKDTNNQ
jgi:hypothetical protein